jgi:hypothetical protein
VDPPVKNQPDSLWEKPRMTKRTPLSMVSPAVEPYLAVDLLRKACEDCPMKFTLRLFSFILAIAAAEAKPSYQSEFYGARELKAHDPDAALQGMQRSFRMAVDAGNADYATAAGNSACFWMHERGDSIGAGKFAREVITALGPMGYEHADGDALRRTELFGHLERGLLAEGRIGAAWQANRAAAENLRGRQTGADADGRSITVKEVAGLPAKLKSLGWRLLEREADILDYAGRSLEARALLDEAAAAMGDAWTEFPRSERFYAFKLLARRADLLDFLGYDLEAIEVQRSLLGAAEQDTQRTSGLTLRINLLRNLSQWDGPTPEILAQAGELAAGILAKSPGSGAARLLAKMELDLKHSQQAIDALRDEARKRADLGQFLESAYADRDSLVSRTNAGEDKLDAEFVSVLTRMRAQGNKRGEPSLYAEYGAYLLRQDRPGEAIVMFQEALRLKRSFGLVLHQAALLSSLFDARLGSGDREGAQATLAELEELLRDHHEEMPRSRRVHAETLRAIALAKLGQTAAAKTALELARSLAAGLPEYRRLLLAPDQESRILQLDQISAAVTAATGPSLRVQPLEVVSVTAPGTTARTRFIVSNPGSTGVAGQWQIRGPGASSNASGSASFTAGSPETTLEIPLTIPGGGEAELELLMAPAADIAEAKVRVDWRSVGKETESSSWDLRWEAGAAGRVVLDASLLETSPFRSISLFHELALPPGAEPGIPFRLRSPVPLRFEYYAAANQDLLAVDADGNGDFSDRGDFHGRGPSGIACAHVPARPDRGSTTVEIRIFAPTGEPLAITPALLLESEIYRGGEWVKEAESVLR